MDLRLGISKNIANNNNNNNSGRSSNTNNDNTNFTSRYQSTSCRSSDVAILADDDEPLSPLLLSLSASSSGQRPPRQLRRRRRRRLGLKLRQHRFTIIGIITVIVIGMVLVDFNNNGRRLERMQKQDAMIQHSQSVERVPATTTTGSSTSTIIMTKKMNANETNEETTTLKNGILIDDSDMKIMPSSSLVLAANDDDESRIDTDDDINHENDSDTDTLPIYLLRPLSSSASSETITIATEPSFTSVVPAASPVSFEFAQISWNNLSQTWNRTIHYQNLFPLAGRNITSSLPFAAAFSTLKNSSSSSSSSSLSTTTTRLRTIILLHTSPKTGSTTLRLSCTHNLQRTCNATQSPSELRHHAPPGYYNETTFFGLVRECMETHHFCIKDILFFPSLSSSSSSNDNAEISTITGTSAKNITIITPSSSSSLPQKYPNTLFIHTFPFRTYDEWVIRALRQQYYRAEEAGCNRTKSLLTEHNCKRDNMELDIRKYSKLRMMNVWRSVVQRLDYWKKMRRRRNNGGKEEEEEHHVFLLYQHSELHRTMQLLSDMYGIPKLPGLEKRMKVGRQKERRKKKKRDAVAAATTSERRKMSESIVWDKEGSKTTKTQIDEFEEKETTTWCKEEELLLSMFHSCFSDELMMV